MSMFTEQDYEYFYFIGNQREYYKESLELIDSFIKDLRYFNRHFKENLLDDNNKITDNFIKLNDTIISYNKKVKKAIKDNSNYLNINHTTISEFLRKCLIFTRESCKLPLTTEKLDFYYKKVVKSLSELTLNIYNFNKLKGTNVMPDIRDIVESLKKELKL